MKIFIQLFLALYCVAYGKSDTHGKLSGRLLSIGGQCDKYCVDTLRIKHNSTMKYLAISVLSSENPSLNFGDSIEFNYYENNKTKFATKFKKYTGFDDWYIGDDGAIACWNITINDSIGKISEKQICISKNTDSRTGRSASISSSCGSIKGARIIGISFHPNLLKSDSTIEISTEWNVGYEHESRTVIKRFQVINGNKKINGYNSDGFTVKIKKTRKIDSWMQ